MTAKHDVFLSYRWDDRSAVEPLLEALTSRGLRVWQDAREVETMTSIQHAVATGLAGSRSLLAWYSGRYNASRACQWELTSAYVTAQSEGDPRRRILVVNPERSNAHVHLPELFDQLHLNGVGVAAHSDSVSALAEDIRAALTHVPTTCFGTLSPLTPPLWLPAMGTGSTRFVGRLREMWQLHGALQAGQAAMLTGNNGKAGLAQLRGAGGAGKTLMAEEYALRFGAAYPGGVFWLRAFGEHVGGSLMNARDRSDHRDGQYLDIAIRLGIDASNLKPAEVRAALSRHFAKIARPFLWVVDDLPFEFDAGEANVLSGWEAPHPLGCTLVTTRSRRINHITAIELLQLEVDDSRHLLTRGQRLSADQTATADAIGILLGRHALAVDVTAALVGRRGVAAVLQDLQNPSRDALDLAAQLDETLPNGYQRQIANAFLASIEQLDEGARDVLRCACLLAVAPIPASLLVDLTVAGLASDKRSDETANGADARAVARDNVDLAISRLLATSLADDAGDGAITVHALVSRTVRFAGLAPSHESTLRERLIRLLSQHMRDAGEVNRHAELATWVEHARELTRSIDDLATAGLLNKIALYDLNRAAYALAFRGFKRGLELRTQLSGEDHPDTLTAMGNLATTLHHQGDLHGARQLAESVLEARQRVHGDEHPDVLLSKQNLALILSDQGDLPRAGLLLAMVLEGSARLHGPEHPTTLRAMHNMTVFSADTGEGTAATHRANFESMRRVFGDEHPVTLATMLGVGRALEEEGDLNGATTVCSAVLEIRKRVLGEEHPDTAWVMNQLGTILRAQGKLSESKALQGKAVEISRRTLGAEHFDTLRIINDLEITRSKIGDESDGSRRRLALLKAARNALGDVHPNTLQASSNLAVTLWNEGNFLEARQLQAQAAADCLRILGAKHPTSVDAQQKLAQMHGIAGISNRAVIMALKLIAHISKRLHL